MISTHDLAQKISAHIAKRSGLQVRRSYLGMSQIWKCPRVLFEAWQNGNDVSEFSHRMAYTGYMHERDVLDRLREMGVAKMKRSELVADDFDQRLRGHTDGEMSWGDLLEIKSVSGHKYEMVQYHGRALHEHVDQVQLYMLYGGYHWTWMVYVNRETFEHSIVRVAFDPERAKRLVLKAKRVLAAIDAGLVPECECGRCGEAGGRYQVSGVRKGGE